MTDLALLEAAARAAGLTLKTDEDGKLRASPDGHWWPVWNTLDSDGDALRLAVRLRIGVQCHQGRGDYVLADDGDGHECCISFGPDSDPYAATRRAIVRAAAAMDATC